MRSARALPLLPRGRWSSWSADVKRKRYESRIARAVLIERIAREKRRASRAGDYIPGATDVRARTL